MTAGCNAWFYCEEDRGCVDWQTQRSVSQDFCVLMTASARPQPEPQHRDVKRPFGFFSYQAGYLKGERPCGTSPLLQSGQFPSCWPTMLSIALWACSPKKRGAFPFDSH